MDLFELVSFNQLQLISVFSNDIHINAGAIGEYHKLNGVLKFQHKLGEFIEENSINNISTKTYESPNSFFCMHEISIKGIVNKTPFILVGKQKNQEMYSLRTYYSTELLPTDKKVTTSYLRGIDECSDNSSFISEFISAIKVRNLVELDKYCVSNEMFKISRNGDLLLNGLESLNQNISIENYKVHCFEDNDIVVIEYTSNGWGNEALVSPNAVMVLDLEESHNKIVSVSIYDNARIE